MNKSRHHDDAVVEMLRDDWAFAQAYLHAAFEELDQDGGVEGFLMALRHLVEARGGMACIADKTGLSRETLYRTLSPKGNPTLKTMKQVVHATGLRFAAVA